jgi:hypothetical protein
MNPVYLRMEFNGNRYSFKNSSFIIILGDGKSAKTQQS